MTRDEALALKTFKHCCTCGGFAWSMNERPESQPHSSWCPQRDEYGEWWAALHLPKAEPACTCGYIRFVINGYDNPVMHAPSCPIYRDYTNK